jgi:hypothetical protein
MLQQDYTVDTVVIGAEKVSAFSTCKTEGDKGKPARGRRKEGKDLEWQNERQWKT